MGNNIRTHPPRVSQDLVSQNLKTLIFLLFFQYWGGGPRKVNDLLTSPINQFRLFYSNRIEKLVPLNYRFPTGNQKTSNENRPNRFQTLTFGRNLGFQKPGSRLR